LVNLKLKLAHAIKRNNNKNITKKYSTSINASPMIISSRHAFLLTMLSKIKQSMEADNYAVIKAKNFAT